MLSSLLPKPVSVATWARFAHPLRQLHQASTLLQTFQAGKLQLGASVGLGRSQGSCCRPLIPVGRVSRSTAGTVATMDKPPPGYRANVGICLVNNRNEVRSSLVVLNKLVGEMGLVPSSF